MYNIVMFGSKHSYSVSKRRSSYRSKVARFGGGSRHKYRSIMRKGRKG